MKSNCKLMNSDELAKIAALKLSRQIGQKITFKSDSCYLKDDGCLRFVFMDETGTFGAQRTFTGNELAYEIGMPFWEVVSIDNGDFEDFEILFYEEK